MFKQGIRQLTTVVLRSTTDMSTSYSVRVSQAQGVVTSLTGRLAIHPYTLSHSIAFSKFVLMYIQYRANIHVAIGKHSIDPFKTSLG